jgi:hypothetical protein
MLSSMSTEMERQEVSRPAHSLQLHHAPLKIHSLGTFIPSRDSDSLRPRSWVGAWQVIAMEAACGLLLCRLALSLDLAHLVASGDDGGVAAVRISP